MDDHPFARPASVARNLSVLATVAGQGLEDDPVRLMLLAARRLPRRWRGPLAGALSATGRSLAIRSLEALGLFLADRPDDARAVLQAVSTPDPGRLVCELAVQVDSQLPDDVPARVRARASWQRGDLTAALEALDGQASRASRRYRTRLASELATMKVGYAVQLSRGVRAARLHPLPEHGQGHRVLHLLTNSLPWTQSGYALRSHSILRAQVACGTDVEAVTRVGYPVTVGLPFAAELDTVDGIPYRRLLPARLASTPEGRLVQTADLLTERVRRFAPDVLHTTTHYPNALVVRAVAESAGRPWVYEARGQLEKTWLASRPSDQREEAERSERFVLWHARETEMALAADHVVVLSDVMREDFAARGIPERRMTVVPNAVDDALLDPALDCSPRDARARLGLPEDGFWVGTVSSVVDYEGLDHLLQAVADLRAGGRDVRCAIVGDGTARPALEELVATLGIGDMTVMPGRVPMAQAASWHRALDVFTVPRRDTEVTRTVTPLKPIEAMAVGRPVVASDLPALAEIVRRPGSGLLAAPDDPSSLAGRIRDLYDDQGLRRSLGVRGREFAATRTWRAMAGRYETIYDSLGRAP